MSNNQELEMPVLTEDLGMLFVKKDSLRKIHYGLFKCKCGNIFKTSIDSVSTGNTKSCGCVRSIKTIKRNTTHGMRYHPIYNNWKNMVQRCNNINSVNFKYYGARGIEVCERWLNVKNFIEDMYPTFKEGLSIDRIDNDGNYEPSNCRWVTKTAQSRNTRQLWSSNKSGYRGVSWNKARRKWVAMIKINNKQKYIGSFIDKLDAAKAYDKYVVENELGHTTNGLA